MLRNYFFNTIVILTFATSSVVAETTTPLSGDSTFSDAPTFIKAKSLSLLSKERRFEYLGPVEVKQGDMLLTSSKLIGNYDAQNQIITLTALGNVVITKGEGIPHSTPKLVGHNLLL